MRIAVVDPRCSKTASRAWKWLPIKSNGVAAVSMGIIHWIIENQRYNARYLANANKAAAKADNEPTWTQTAWLVKINPDGTPGVFLRGSDIGLAKEKRVKKEGGEWEFDPFLVLKNGQPNPFDPNSETEAVEGELLVDTDIKGLKVKSVLQIYREAAGSRQLSEWADLAGVQEHDLVELAREFTNYGKRAVADIHRGVSQHTSGFYNVLVYMTLNTLIGNHDWQGGLSKATTYTIDGSKEGQPFNLKKHEGKIQTWGVDIIRHGKPYDKSTLFQGYPAKRPWYPFCSDIYQEVIPSMAMGTPIPIRSRPSCSTWPRRCTPCREDMSSSKSSRTQKGPPDLRLRHRHRRDQHVRRLHLPGPDLLGALGIRRFAPFGDPQGVPLPPAGRRAPERHRDGLRRKDAPLHGVHGFGHR